MSRTDATRAVDGVFDAITTALKNGDEVRLVGFGTFTVASRAASEGRNPRTGEKIQIPATKQPKFKAGKGLKDAIN
jgi:DNA-binding protein HU-beta